MKTKIHFYPHLKQEIIFDHRAFFPVPRVFNVIPQENNL